MKKNNNIKIDSNKKREAERLSDRAVLLTALSILYAFLLLFLQKMSMSTSTVLGAQAFIRILFWGSIAGAMLCAAWGAYKENRDMLTYSGVFVYILWSMAVIQYCGTMGTGKAYTLVYASLITAFVLGQIYFALRSSGRLATKKARTIFAVISVALFVLFSVAALALRFRMFGLGM
ncbi:MAG: hypothetical protein ACI4SS_05335 [Clostridia bacterium]